MISFTKGRIYILLNHPVGLVRLHLSGTVFYRRDIYIKRNGTYYVHALRLGKNYYKKWYRIK